MNPADPDESPNNPGKVGKESSLEDQRDLPSIYVGESSCSLHERIKEHFKDYSKDWEESHMFKPWSNSHPGNTRSRFVQRVVHSFKSDPERQVGEAVGIQLIENTLNSVEVFNRCKLTRLVVDREWDRKVRKDNWQGSQPRDY